MHLVHDAGLPGVLHNRHIVNFHTGERKTDEGFAAYQLGLIKFLLSMLYLHEVYRAMGETGSELLDEEHPALLGFACVGLGMAAVTLPLRGGSQGRPNALTLVAAMGTWASWPAHPRSAPPTLTYGMTAVAVSALLVTACVTQIHWAPATEPATPGG